MKILVAIIIIVIIALVVYFMTRDSNNSNIYSAGFHPGSEYMVNNMPSTIVLNLPRPPATLIPGLFTTPTDYQTYINDRDLYNQYTRQALDNFSRNFPSKPIDQFRSYWYFVPMGV